MTTEELQRLANDVEVEADRFEALHPAARRRLAVFEPMFERARAMAAALRAFIKAAPPPDHPGFAEPSFVAMRDMLAVVRREIDRAAARRPRSDRN